MSHFTDRVLKVVRNIPQGQTRSYKEVAEHAGSPGAYRTVGSILKKNQDFKVPCHRVIQSSGKAGYYNGLRGTSKEEILFQEKIRLNNNRKQM